MFPRLSQPTGIGFQIWTKHTTTFICHKQAILVHLSILVFVVYTNDDDKGLCRRLLFLQQCRRKRPEVLLSSLVCLTKLLFLFFRFWLSFFGTLENVLVVWREPTLVAINGNNGGGGRQETMCSFGAVASKRNTPPPTKKKRQHFVGINKKPPATMNLIIIFFTCGVNGMMQQWCNLSICADAIVFRLVHSNNGEVIRLVMVQIHYLLVLLCALVFGRFIRVTSMICVQVIHYHETVGPSRRWVRMEGFRYTKVLFIIREITSMDLMSIFWITCCLDRGIMIRKRYCFRWIIYFFLLLRYRMHQSLFRIQLVVPQKKKHR